MSKVIEEIRAQARIYTRAKRFDLAKLMNQTAQEIEQLENDLAYEKAHGMQRIKENILAVLSTHTAADDASKPEEVGYNQAIADVVRSVGEMCIDHLSATLPQRKLDVIRDRILEMQGSEFKGPVWCLDGIAQLVLSNDEIRQFRDEWTETA